MTEVSIKREVEDNENVEMLKNIKKEKEDAENEGCFAIVGLVETDFKTELTEVQDNEFLEENASFHSSTVSSFIVIYFEYFGRLRCPFFHSVLLPGTH